MPVYKVFRKTVLFPLILLLISLVRADEIDPQKEYYDKALTLMGNLPKSENQTEDIKKMVNTVEELYKKFPDEGKEPLLYLYVAEAVEDADLEQAKPIYKRIKELGSDQWKATAEGSLHRLEMIGKPVQIKYTALDGRKVDLAKLKGKVVLVDFWATWCGPCMKELPNVIESYNKYHKKGFEIIGINLDIEKEQLKGVLKETGMVWPQYYDGSGWDNKFTKQFGIPSLPSMWLIDKKGILVDLNAKNKLDDKITKLLAEK